MKIIYLQVLDEIEENGIHIYPLPDCDSDEEDDYKEQVCIVIKFILIKFLLFFG